MTTQKQPTPTVYPLRLINGILFMDNSSLSLINECMRKSAYGLSLALKQSRDETALTFGKIMHKVLEERYSRGSGMVTTAMETAMRERAVKEFAEWQPPEGDFRNLNQALNCIADYNLEYMHEDFEILEVNGHAGTETPFAVPLTELHVGQEIYVVDEAAGIYEPTLKRIEWLPVVFTGRIDLVVKDAMGVWILDHKTTSIGGANFFSEFYISMQFKGYAYALKQIMGLTSYPNGVIINGIVNRRPTRTGTSIEFLRDYIHLSPDVIDEWKQSFIQTIAMYLHGIMSQQFPLQTASCVSKYGKCEFYDVCQLPVAQRGIMLRSGNYVSRTWNPIEDIDPQQVKDLL